MEEVYIKVPNPSLKYNLVVSVIKALKIFP